MGVDSGEADVERVKKCGEHTLAVDGGSQEAFEFVVLALVIRPQCGLLRGHGPWAPPGVARDPTVPGSICPAHESISEPTEGVHWTTEKAPPYGWH